MDAEANSKESKEACVQKGPSAESLSDLPGKYGHRSMPVVPHNKFLWTKKATAHDMFKLKEEENREIERREKLVKELKKHKKFEEDEVRRKNVKFAKEMVGCLDVHTGTEEPVCGLELWSTKDEEVVGGPGWVRVRAVIDSGAGASVGPRSLVGKDKLRESPGSRNGQHFTSASGETLKNEGEVVLNSFTEQGQTLCATFQIADITRPLLSVSKICEKGNFVYFGQRGGVILHTVTGMKTYFTRENGIYVLDLYIKEADMGF